MKVDSCLSLHNLNASLPTSKPNLNRLQSAPNRSRSNPNQPPQGLAAATSLDEVRRCHAAFQEAALRQCCQGGGRGRGATWRHIGASLAQLLDVALRACRTHGRLLELRYGDGDDGGKTNTSIGGGSCEGRGMAAAARAAAALEVAALRGELAAAAAAWKSGRAYLLRIMRNKALQLGGDDDVDALFGALGFNAYYAE